MKRTQRLVVACTILVASAIFATDAVAQTKINKCYLNGNFFYDISFGTCNTSNNWEP